MESSSEEQNSARKIPRNRTRARRASSVERERTSRRLVSKEKEREVPQKVTSPKPEMPKSEQRDGRKAPTPLASKKKFLSQRRKRTMVATLFLLVGVGASAAVGMTDGGQIDVNKTIEERNERVRNNMTDERDVGGSMVEVPVQNTNVEIRGDGGLRGRGIVKLPPTPTLETDISSSTASSSEETTIGDEDNDNVQEEVSDTEVLEEDDSILEISPTIAE